MKFFIPLILVGLGACGDPPIECRHTSDCQTNEFCRSRACAQLSSMRPTDSQFSPASQEVEPETFSEGDLGVDADVDSRVDLPPHPCSTASAPNSGDLIINEVNANVAPGVDGDANGDGVRDAYQDEFMELWNTTTSTLRLDGVEVLVGDSLKWKFDEPYCMPPGQAFVLFANGTPRLAPDIPVVNAETRLSLSNSGGTATLRRQQETLDRFEWGPDAECSWVRSPEGVIGATPIPHTMCGGLFSPGRCCDGTPTQDGCPPVQP